MAIIRDKQYFSNYATTVPVLAVGANAGTGATVVFELLAAVAADNDHVGKIKLTTGTGSTAGAMATLSYNDPYKDSYVAVFLTAANAATAGLEFYISSSTYLAFTVSTNNAPADSTVYAWYYHTVAGYPRGV